MDHHSAAVDVYKRQLIRSIALDSTNQSTLTAGIVDELTAISQKSSGRCLIGNAAITVFFHHIDHDTFSQIQLVDDGSAVFFRSKCYNFLYRLYGFPVFILVQNDLRLTNGNLIACLLYTSRCV